MPEGERCLRCAAAMEWRHGTWQCPRCRFKVGCCEGETGECALDAAPSRYAAGLSSVASATGAGIPPAGSA